MRFFGGCGFCGDMGVGGGCAICRCGGCRLVCSWGAVRVVWGCGVCGWIVGEFWGLGNCVGGGTAQEMWVHHLPHTQRTVPLQQQQQQP